MKRWKLLLSALWCLMGFWSLAGAQAFALDIAPEYLDHSDAPALTTAERALPFDASFLRWEGDDAYWQVGQAQITLQALESFTPWQTMTLVQKLSGLLLPLDRFGDQNSPLLRAWKAKLEAYLAAEAKPQAASPQEVFNPLACVWDPGWVQQRNSLGQWYIHLYRRNILQSDVASLSPLEVAQAVKVLTGRRYSNQYILRHLEAFRTQLRVEQRLESHLSRHNPR